MKNEKGITLIALIITIIVMLILVAVTINVALKGGLLEKAKDATTKTSREVSREQIVAAMIGAYDNNGNFIKANVELPEETKWCLKDENYSNASGEGNYVVTKNNEKFYVNPTDGTVLDEEPQGVDNLVPTGAEKELADSYNSADGAYAYNFVGEKINYQEAQSDPDMADILLQGDNNVFFMWLCTEKTSQAYGGGVIPANKWVYAEGAAEYTGPCPIAFTEQQLQNNSYLNRIYNSFNNN